jgi:hypothetical protein
MLELPEGHKFDPGIAWDDIGIDMLIVDEAAAFKNSYKPEAREHGLPKFMGSGGDGSKRAWQLDFRAAAVRQRPLPVATPDVVPLQLLLVLVGEAPLELLARAARLATPDTVAALVQADSPEAALARLRHFEAGFG